MFRKFIIALAVLAATLGSTLQASAEVLTWEIRSTYPYRLYLEFYSQDYDHSWPGGGEVYVLEDSRFHTYRLECRRGEKVCYGAWVTTDESTYWGVGPYNSYGCSDCCYVCGGRSNRITLTR